jgi:hypothetical protein
MKPAPARRAEAARNCTRLAALRVGERGTARKTRGSFRRTPARFGRRSQLRVRVHFLARTPAPPVGRGHAQTCQPSPACHFGSLIAVDRS